MRAVVIASCALLSNVLLTSADASTGRTPGNFGVSTIGSAQYSIPLWTPPGPHGVQPRLALSYDSASGVGPLGMGWSLSGLGAITRCNRTFAQDGSGGQVTLSINDGYCLNGKRLRLTSGSGTYGAAGSTYQTEIADFSLVIANSSVGSTGPATWTVKGRDGFIYQYGLVDTNGNGANSQVLAGTVPYMWLLSKVTDRSGNNYVINYLAPNTTTLINTTVPDTILWAPTSNGAATYQYSVKFNYATNAASSSPAKFVDGTSVLNTTLLTSVAVYNSGAVVRDYFVGYRNSTTTGKNEINTVQECADSTKTNCLLATNIGYQDGTPGVSATVSGTATSASTPVGLLSRYDFNGDGIPDLLYVNGGITYVVFGSPTGYLAPQSSGLPGYNLAGNMDGGDRDGVLVNQSGYWWYYKWNGSTFTGSSTGLTVDTTMNYYQLADEDGDGRADLVAWKQVPNPSLPSKVDEWAYTWFSSGTAGAVTFGSRVSVLVASGVVAAQPQLPDQQRGRIKHYDFNGDGKDDLVLMLVSGTAGAYSMTTYAEQSNGLGGFTSSAISVLSGSLYVPLQFLQENDDGCIDYVLSTSFANAMCNGQSTTFKYVGTVVAVMDWDGDGRTDVVVANGSTLGVYLSTGSGLSTTLTTTSVPYNSSCQYVVTDVNGDGLDDLLCWSSAGSNPITYYLHSGPTPDLAISFADGFGNAFSISYRSMTDPTVYAKDTTAVYPNQDFISSMQLVAQVTPTNGIGGTYGLSYTYSGAVADLQGRGLLAFHDVKFQDSRTGFFDYHYYFTSFPTSGLLQYHIVTQSTSATVSKVTNAVVVKDLDSTAYNQRFFPYIGSSTELTYEVGGGLDGKLIKTTLTQAVTAPDNYGNFTDVKTTVTDSDSTTPSIYNGSQWSTETISTITPDTSNWCLNLPSEVDVSNTAFGTTTTITRHTGYTPDTTMCRQTQRVVEPSLTTTYKVTTDIQYDGFGNADYWNVTGPGINPRLTQMSYGTDGIYPQYVKKRLAGTDYTTNINFDYNTGQLHSVTDPNSIATSWSYDGFGRKISETRPDGTVSTWAYNDCAAAGCVNTNNKITVVQVNTRTDGTTTVNTSNTYLDTLERTLVTSGQMLNGAYDLVETQYDSRGNVYRQGMPCTFSSCTQYWTTNTYDNLHRLTQSQRPISASNSTLQTTTISYQGVLTTTTDPQGKNSIIYTKVTGDLGRTQDHNNYYIAFTQDGFGSLLSVDDSSHNLRTVAYDYGVGAFARTLTDNDLGTRAYSYDSLGERTSWSDGKSQPFSQTYDDWGRPLVRSEPDLTTTWTWGTTAASHNIGKLASVSSVDSGSVTYGESYGYDSVGRKSSTTINLPVVGAQTFNYAYDSTGPIQTMTFPASYPSTYRLKVNYLYSYGHLRELYDGNVTSTIWWAANSTNARGQITNETEEDLSGHPQIVTSRVYDAVTGWLSSIQTGISSGSALQNEAYLYDKVGNVTQRQNNNAGLTENFYYDNLNRLDHSTLDGSTNLQMCYDNTSGACVANQTGPGNITSRSDLAGGAAWTYDPTHTHRVTQAGSASYTYAYDLNGNVQTRNGSTINWTSYNYPSRVATSTESASFSYGPNRQRWYMGYTGSAGVENTYYATPAFEIVGTSSGTDYRHYLYAGTRAVAVISRTTAGAVNVRSLLIDHQGSISSIVNEATGSALIGESFAAYGSRRQASTWSGTPSTADQSTMNGVTRQGFTFQTILGSMGLIHMNGRIHDAITGRFLSADPQVAHPINTQDYNRYSYVNNNPLTNLDPTGFDEACVEGDTGRTIPCTLDPITVWGHVGNPDRSSTQMGLTSTSTGNQNSGGANGSGSGGGGQNSDKVVPPPPELEDPPIPDDPPVPDNPPICPGASVSGNVGTGAVVGGAAGGLGGAVIRAGRALGNLSAELASIAEEAEGTEAVVLSVAAISEIGATGILGAGIALGPAALVGIAAFAGAAAIYNSYVSVTQPGC